MSRTKRKRPTKQVRDVHSSTIDQHHQHGNKLIPPLADVPQMQFKSWRDTRLPEMLWAALLVSRLRRPDALNIFREVAEYVHKSRKTKTPPFDITLSGLAKLDAGVLTELLQIITATEDRKATLLPLLLLRDLPARDFWEKALKLKPATDDWQSVKVAVARTLDHQSQESTDCRWARLLCVMAAGKLTVPHALVEEVFQYPDYGDMRNVRPSIRATELVLDEMWETETQWPHNFWSQCLKDTGCYPLPSVSPALSPVVGTTPERVGQVYDLVLEHCYQTIFTTAIDAKHDTVFGFAFYCLTILRELLRIGASQSITARIALRTIVVCYITLAYLAKNDDLELWKSYRVYGSGQAKLQYLKFDASDVKPEYVSVETLKAIANEDIWEEYLPIDLGHWEKANLRSLSIDAGTKDTYDQYYSWSSSFTHGHWGSVRDAVFDSCGNPLHRLHRIPKKSSRALPDIVPDACALTDKVLELLSNCYPVFTHRVTVSL